MTQWTDIATDLATVLSMNHINIHRRLIFLLSFYSEDEQERVPGLQNISPKHKQGPPTSCSAKATAFFYLSCVVDILLQKRFMLPEGEVLFGMWLLQTGFQDHSFTKKLAGATSNRTCSDTKSLKEVSLHLAKVPRLLN